MSLLKAKGDGEGGREESSYTSKVGRRSLHLIDTYWGRPAAQFFGGLI